MKTYACLLFFLICYGSNFSQISDFDAIDFTMADNIAKLNEGHDLDNLPLLAHKLTYKLPTKVEKFRAIYLWVCNNVKGDYNQHHKVSKKRKEFQNDSTRFIQWNRAYKKIVFEKLRKRKKTMCTGYAYLIKELCHLAGIECKIVDGYGRTLAANVHELEIPNHSWNAVKLNQKWYLCDATWSSGYMNGNNVFVKDYNEGYFLTDPVLFYKNHYPLHKDWLFEKDISSDVFVGGPLVYGETFRQNVVPIIPNSMNLVIQKGDKVKFGFNIPTNSNKKDIALVYYSANKERRLTLDQFNHTNGKVTFYHLFKTRGTYDVHAKINNQIVATYTIKVTRDSPKIASIR